MAIGKIMDPNAAASAYANTAKTLSQGLGVTGNDKGPSFAAMMREGVENAVGAMKGGEKMTADAIMGQADLTDVVQAVTSAESALQTVVALRDRMVGAYQEIMRMPI